MAGSAVGKIKASRVNNLDAATYVGPEGQMWYDVDTGVLRLGDDVTPGGTIVGGGGSGAGNVAGPTGALQYNDSGVLGGTGNVTTDGTNLTVVGNVSGEYILGNGAFLSGVITSVANINNGASNISIAESDGNATVSISGVANVATFNPTGLAVNAIATDNYLYANGAPFGGSIDLSNVAQSILPNGNSVFSLGSPTNQWKDLYISNNTIYINGIPLSANIIQEGNISSPQLIFNGAPVVTTGPDAAPITTNISTTANISGDTLISNAVSTTDITSTNLTSSNITSTSVISNVVTTTSVVANIVNSTTVWSENMSAGGNIVGNVIIGNVFQYSNGVSIINTYGNAEVANFLPYFTGDLSAGNAVITGNLQVIGTIVSVDVTTLAVENLQVTVGSTTSIPSALTGAGILVGNAPIASWLYEYTTNSWQSDINITPFANGTLNIGGPLNYWNTIYANNLSLLNNVTTTGNLTGNNISATGFISAAGNINGANLSTTGAINSAGAINSSGAIFATGNIGGGNVRTNGQITAAGNITGGNITTNGSFTGGSGTFTQVVATSNLIGARVYTNLGGNISADGNVLSNVNIIAGGNIRAGGSISATGNISATGKVFAVAGLETAYVNASQYIQTTSTVQGSLLYSTGNILGNGIVSTTGNITGNYFFGNIAFANGAAPTYGNSNVASYMPLYLPTYSGNLAANILSVVGNVTAANFIGNVVGNVSGNIGVPGANTNVLFNTSGNANASANLTFNTDTSLLSVTGNIAAANIAGGNISVTGNVSANILVATDLRYPTGVSVINGINANIANLVVSTTGTTSNVNILQSQVTSLTGRVYTNSNVANYLPTYNGNLDLVNSITAQANVGFLSDLSVAGNVICSNFITNGSAGNIIGANVITANTVIANANVQATYFIGNGALLTGVITSLANINNGNSNVTIQANGNVSVGVAGTNNIAVWATTGEYVTGVISATGNVRAANIVTGGIVTAAGNISSGSYILGNGAFLTGIITSVSNMVNGTSNVNIATTNANVSVAVSGVGNVALFTPTGLSVTSNVSAGNISTVGNVYVGAILTVGGAVNITGATGLTANNISGTGTIIMGAVSSTGTVLAAGNITSNSSVNATNSIVGNVHVGNAFNYPNGVSIINNYSNANVANYLPTYTGNLAAGNVVIAGNLQVNGTTTTVNSNTLSVANLQIFVASTSNTQSAVNTAGLVVGNTTGNTAIATWLYDFTTNSWQSSLDVTPVTTGTKSLGNATNTWQRTYTDTLIGTTVTVTGNVQGGNIRTAGQVSATGNIATAGQVSATGNINTAGNLYGGNLILTGSISSTVSLSSSGVVYAVGNVDGGNIRTVGQVTALGNVTGGNIRTIGLVTATGNITGGNFNTAGAVTAVGNVSAGSYLNATTGVVTATVSASGSVTANNIVANNTITATGNISAANFTTTANVFAGNVAATNTISATGNIYTAGYFIGNFQGNVSGNIVVPGANTNILFNNNGNAGASANLTFNGGTLGVTGDATVSGNVVGGYIYGNGVYLTGLPAQYSNANVAAYLPVYSGNIGGGNLNLTANVSANTLLLTADASITGNVIANGDLNVGIISPGIGNITAYGNIYGGLFIGNGAGLTNTAASRLVNGTSNVEIPFADSAITVGIGGTGNVAGWTTAGQYLNGKLSVSGNITTGSGATGLLFRATTVFGNPVAAMYSTNVTPSSSNWSMITTGNSTYFNAYNNAGLNIAGSNIVDVNGSGMSVTGYARVSGDVSSVGNVYAGNVSTAGNVYGVNATFSGDMSVAGNLAVAGNITFTDTDVIVTNDLYIQLANNQTELANVDGAGLSVGPAGNSITNWTYSTTANAWSTNVGVSVAGDTTTSNLVAFGSIAAAAGLETSGVYTGEYSDGIVVDYVTGNGRISVGSTDGINFYNGGVANTALASLSAGGSFSTTGTIIGSNFNTTGVVTATANITTSGYFLGNGAFLTGVITSVANINNGTSNVAITTANANVTVGVGGTSNVAVFATTGEYVTGVVSATGNITGGNLTTAGAISATGIITSVANITGGNINTAGTASAAIVTASGNVIGGNIATAGLVTATGNITGGNIATAGLVTATGNVTGGNITTEGTASAAVVTASGNVTGANFNTAGLVTATGNVTGGNILTSGLVSATGNATAGNLLTSGLVSATGNVTGGNILTSGYVSATGNATTGFGGLLAGVSGYEPLPSTTIQVTSNANTYAQMNAQNLSDGTQASTDYVATADIGSDTEFFVDLGIASSNYSNTSANNSLGTAVAISDAYLYTVGATATGNVQGGNLVLGAVSTGRNVKIIAGGSATGNVIGLFAAGGLSVLGNVTTDYFVGNGSALTGVIATGIGTLATLTVTGNTQTGNLLTGGAVSATGNITGGNVLTGGLVSVAGNITSGNVLTSTVNASGVTANSVTFSSATGSTYFIPNTPNVTGTGSTIVWAAPSTDVNGFKITVRMQVSDGSDVQMAEILCAQNSGGDVSFTTYGRVSTNPAATPYVITASTDAGGVLNLIINSGTDSVIYTYEVTEFYKN